MNVVCGMMGFDSSSGSNRCQYPHAPILDTPEQLHGQSTWLASYLGAEEHHFKSNREILANFFHSYFLIDDI
jgi:hypothetical protein